MTQPRYLDGAPALLFERLQDLEPFVASEPSVFRYLTADQLRASVRREIERLIDTRRSVTIAEMLADEGELTVMEYGVPDYSTISPRSPDERRLFALALTKAIAAFEPRLKFPQVLVTEGGRPGTIAIALEGEIRIGTEMELLTFAVELNVKSTSRTVEHVGS